MSRTSLNGPYRVLPATFGVLALVFGAPAEAAKRPAKRAQVVCFKKAGKKVCRKRRAVRKPAPLRLSVPAPAPIAAPPAEAAAAPVLPTPSLTPLPPAETSASETAPAPAAAQPDCGTSPWGGYVAEDRDGVFRLSGRRACVPGTTVLFQLVNRDAQEHNLYAEGLSPRAPKRAIVASLDPEQTAEASATLAAGEWRLFCDIEGHGTMSRTLTVLG